MMINKQPAREYSISARVSTWLAGLVILCVASGTALAREATLHLQRNDAGSVLQQIPLASWRFDKARKVLRAQSVAGGMVFITSGYSAIGGNPGNVLLAFGVE